MFSVSSSSRSWASAASASTAFFLEAAALLAFAVSFLGAAFLAGVLLGVLFFLFFFEFSLFWEALSPVVPFHASTKSG